MRLDARLLHEALIARLELALTVGLGFLAGVLLVGQAWGLSQVISRVFLGGQGLEAVSPLLGLLLALSLARAGLAWGSETLAVRQPSGSKSTCASGWPPTSWPWDRPTPSGERSGELANTAVEGVEALDAYFRQYLPQIGPGRPWCR